MSEQIVSTQEANVITNPETSTTSQFRLQTYNFVGQLPPPEYFERYAAAHPDAAKVILDLAVNQQKILAERDRSEISLYREVMQTDAHYSLRGQWFAFSTVLGFFILTGCAIFRDQSWVAGAALSFTALGYILKIFINRPNRMEEKPQQSSEGGIASAVTPD